MKLHQEIIHQGETDFTDFRKIYLAQAFVSVKQETPMLTRAYAVKNLFTKTKKHIYKNDLILGSIRGAFEEKTPENTEMFLAAEKIAASYGERNFPKNFDHYAPDYAEFLSDGVSGLYKKIKKAKTKFSNNSQKAEFLAATEISLDSFVSLINDYADNAQALLLSNSDFNAETLKLIIADCRHIASNPPKTFRQALQLVWFVHSCFVLEGRYAMALGRFDQYLYPYYKADIENGILDKETALSLIESVFIKIDEYRRYTRKGNVTSEDVVNICIGGCDADGKTAVNDLSYMVLDAVKNCSIAGTNLSARITTDTPDSFLDKTLEIIGSGIGYPALFNDNINIPALSAYGYDIEDVRNYCMVGCIENFLPSKQPPWTDGRFNTPLYLNNAIRLSRADNMWDFVSDLKNELKSGAEEYYQSFMRSNVLPDPENYIQPFLSLFVSGCIEKGLDVNMGGTKYPSVHGACCMGVGTVADSLAAIEKAVFIDKKFTLEGLSDILDKNFEGHSDVRDYLLSLPKYGNNDDFADKYAVWFVDTLAEIFKGYKTYDGGAVYIAMAANTQNISAGLDVSATPDGRYATTPLSDAASPTYGRDIKGVTQTLLSVSKPDYKKAACGTVLNQKFSPDIFISPEKRAKLAALVRVYFENGGQQIQFNATSREMLKDAMENPQNYIDLIVRVSGFSAYYVTLDRTVQEDILARTQQS